MNRTLLLFVLFGLTSCTSSLTPSGEVGESDTDTDADADADADADTDVYVSPTAPVAVDDTFSVDEGQFARPEILANDTDANDAIDLTSIEIVDPPSDGTVTVSPQGVVQYTHEGAENPTDLFTYTVKDVSGETSNLGTVSVQVTPVNDPPTAVDDLGSVVDEGGSDHGGRRGQ